MCLKHVYTKLYALSDVNLWKESNFFSALTQGRPVPFTWCLHAWQEPFKCLLDNENKVLGGMFKLDFEMFREAWNEKESILGKQSIQGEGV